MSTRKKVTAQSSKKKVSKKAVVSRPTKKKSTAKKTTVAKSKPKKIVKTKILKIKSDKSKPKVIKLKKIKAVKPDTTLSCHRCGEVAKVNFEFVWNNGWPVCCREGMHIEASDIKIGEVMNKAWIDAGGYGGSRL